METESVSHCRHSVGGTVGAGAMNWFRGFLDDLFVLKTMWFSKISGDSHKARLDSFYGPQAHAYDRFRAGFLHGRRPLLQACASEVRCIPDSNLVWVDLGGGTGENIDMMAAYMDLSAFHKIYMVDLCGPLCDVAREKVSKRGWQNVEVVEGDVCDFVPPQGFANLVTFSYSLSMIPPFMAAIDKAVSYLDPLRGILGIADFVTSAKYDTPPRQHTWLYRWFWRAVFDLDGIDLGPERRMYLHHTLSTVTELNSSGPIPYVPLLRAPWYVWVGRNRGPPPQATAPPNGQL